MESCMVGILPGRHPARDPGGCIGLNSSPPTAYLITRVPYDEGCSLLQLLTCHMEYALLFHAMLVVWLRKPAWTYGGTV